MMPMNTPEALLKRCAAEVPGIVLDRKTGGLADQQPGLSEELTRRLRAMADEVLPLLLPPADPAAQSSVDLLAELGEKVELVTDQGRAESMVLKLCLDAIRVRCPIGIDMETVPLPEYRSALQTVQITKAGKRAVRQTPPRDEAAALDPHRSRPRLVQCHVGGGVTYIFDMEQLPATVLAPLADHELVAANAKFEHKHWTFNLGLPEPEAWHDCLNGLWLVDGGRWANSDRTLATATKMITGVVLPKGLGASDWSGDLSAEQLAYAALDAIAAYDLYRHVRADLNEQERYVLDLDDACIDPMSRSEWRGIAIDVAAHRALIAKWKQLAVEQDAQVKAETGGAALNTTAEVAAYLSATLGPERLEAWPRTAKTGQLKTGRALLERAIDIAGIKPLVDRSKTEKLLSTFGQATLNNINPVTGRVHTSFRCPGAKTGRLASSKPNLQQVPKRKSKDARKSFVAAPGKVFVGADFSQMELRAAAELSQDVAMKGIYDRGEDLHSTTAMAIAGNTDDSSRTLAKAINFGLLFGAGAETFAAATWAGYGIDLPVADAERHRNTFFATYPGFRAYQQWVTTNAREQGYIGTKLGRRWYWNWEPQYVDDYTGERSGFRYTLALNMPIQGSCAEVVKLALVRTEPVARKHYGAQLLLQVHDEFVFEVDDDPALVRGLIRLLKARMSAAFINIFPNSTRRGLVDAEVGRSWGSMVKSQDWFAARGMTPTADKEAPPP